MSAKTDMIKADSMSSMVTLGHFNRLVVCCIAEDEAQMTAAQWLFEFVQVEEGIRSGHGYDFVRKDGAIAKLDELLCENAVSYRELFELISKMEVIYQTKIDYGFDDGSDIDDQEDREEYEEYQQPVYQPRGWHDDILFKRGNSDWAEQFGAFEL